MVMGSIEIFALILAVICVVKIMFVVINPRGWLKLVKPIYNYRIISLVFLFLAGLVLYSLIKSFTIVQIFAVALFTSLLMASGFVVYGPEMIRVAEKMTKKPFSVYIWIALLVWLALSVWVLFSLFA